MSTPFEFSFAGPDGQMVMSRTKDLGERIHDWVLAEYGDVMAFGILAFDDNKTLVGLRVEGYGALSDDEAPITNDEGWDGASAWVKSLGVKHLFTFVHRQSDFGHDAMPGRWDSEMSEATHAVARKDGLNFQGHIITDGTNHGILPPHRHDQHAMDMGMERGLATLMGMVDDETKAAIGRNALQRMVELDPDADPDTVAAIEMVIERIANGDEFSPEDEQRAEAAANQLTERLERLRNERGRTTAQAAEPDEPKDKRPDVPPAFYN